MPGQDDPQAIHLILTFFVLPVRDKDFFNRYNGGKMAETPFTEFVMNRLVTCAGESRAAALMDRPFVAKS
jgi:hypothetical protein